MAFYFIHIDKEDVASYFVIFSWRALVDYKIIVINVDCV